MDGRLVFANHRRLRRSVASDAAALPPFRGDVRQDRGAQRKAAPFGGLRRFIAAAIVSAIPLPTLAADLPAGFVRLSEVDPGIRQDVRYAGSGNFLGRPVEGYRAGICILTRQAAEALAMVQARLKPDGETLVVFDCYRPERAVADMVAWTAVSEAKDAQWHPDVPRNRLVEQGYLARRSAHSRGSTVDLAIAPIDPADAVPDPDCGALGAKTLDFGTGFDCLDPRSATASTQVSTGARKTRRKLVELMQDAGFRNYKREWWHFTLVDEPFRTGFDFEVAD